MTAGALALALSTSCLLVADPPQFTDINVTVTEFEGFSSTDACDDLGSCCAVIDAEDWQREACYGDVSYGEDGLCASTLCNWASRDTACVSWACDAGCALPEC